MLCSNHKQVKSHFLLPYCDFLLKSTVWVEIKEQKTGKFTEELDKHWETGDRGRHQLYTVYTLNMLCWKQQSMPRVCLPESHNPSLIMRKTYVKFKLTCIQQNTFQHSSKLSRPPTTRKARKTVTAKRR